MSQFWVDGFTMLSRNLKILRKRLDKLITHHLKVLFTFDFDLSIGWYMKYNSGPF